MTTTFTYRVMDQNSFAVADPRVWSTSPAALHFVDQCALFGICENTLADAVALCDAVSGRCVKIL